jgi:adenosylcobinamide-GDP ribazoletransferase
LEPSGLSAAIILTIWIILTGALHLDGLADSADAWMGGHADPERTLTIMKDPACGVIAVITLILVLLLKWNAISILQDGNSWLILFSPVIARMMVVCLIMITPYVREKGVGADMRDHLSMKTAALILVGFAFLLLLGDWQAALKSLIAATVVMLFLRRVMLKKINGFTGDTAGALIEFVETAVLLTLVL